MAVNNYLGVSYGLSSALLPVFPFPIVSTRDPLTSDKSLLGTLWVNKSTNEYFILTSIVSNSATWSSLSNGSGIFSSLEATTGNITADLGNIIATAGNITSVAGSVSAGTTVTAATGLTVSAGGAAITGNSTVTGTFGVVGTTSINQSGAAASNIGVTGTGAVSIGNTTGALALKGVTADLASAAVTINKNAGTNTTEIADGTTTGNYTIGSVNAVVGAVVAKTLNINATAATDCTIATGAGNTLQLGSASSALVSIRSTNVAAGASLQFGNNGPQVMVGTGSPNTVVTAPVGSLFMRTDPAGTTSRLYINTDGTTAWTSFTSAA